MRFQQFMQKAKKSKKVQRGKKQDVNRDGRIDTLDWRIKRDMAIKQAIARRNAGGNKQSNKENQ